MLSKKDRHNIKNSLKDTKYDLMSITGVILHTAIAIEDYISNTAIMNDGEREIFFDFDGVFDSKNISMAQKILIMENACDLLHNTYFFIEKRNIEIKFYRQNIKSSNFYIRIKEYSFDED